MGNAVDTDTEMSQTKGGTVKCHRLKEVLDGKQCFTIIHNSKYELNIMFQVNNVKIYCNNSKLRLFKIVW